MRKFWLACVQASFGALEQLSALQELIQKCLLPSIRGSKWHIYTTPPKQVILMRQPITSICRGCRTKVFQILCSAVLLASKCAAQTCDAKLVNNSGDCFTQITVTQFCHISGQLQDIIIIIIIIITWSANPKREARRHTASNSQHLQLHPEALCMVGAQVIKDLGASFYAAGLVPAANVHFSTPDSSGHEGPYLRPEVMALEGTPPEARGLARKQQPQPEQSQVCCKLI